LGLRILHLHLHGLLRGHDLELGRDSDTGGQTTYVLELARVLAAHQAVDRVEVITRQIHDQRVATDYAQPSEVIGAGALIRRLAFGPRRYLRKELLWSHLDDLVGRLANHLTQQKRLPDWIHAHYADAGYVGAVLARRLRLPLVFTGHSLGREKRRRLMAAGVALQQIDGHYAMVRRIEAEEMALAQSQLVITSTEQERQQQYARYGAFCPERAVVIPPGVDGHSFFPGPFEPLPADSPDGLLPAEPCTAAMLEPFLRDPNRPPVLAICRADPRKNIAALVEAFGRSERLRRHHNLVLVLGCRQDCRALERQPRELMQQLFELVDRYNLYGSVAYPKQHRREQIPALYRWASRLGGVFVNPALSEPFGLTLLEAAACGLPVVATDDGGPRDILQRCKNGLLVDVSDLAALQRAIEQSLSDPLRWQRWRSNGLKAIAEAYSWQAHGEHYLQEVGQRLLSAPPREKDWTPRRNGCWRQASSN